MVPNEDVTEHSSQTSIQGHRTGANPAVYSSLTWKYRLRVATPGRQRQKHLKFKICLGHKVDAGLAWAS